MSFIKKISNSNNSVYNYDRVKSGEFMYVIYNNLQGCIINKLNLKGEIVWEKKLTVSGLVQGTYFYPAKIVSYNGNGVLILMRSYQGHLLLIKMDQAGNLVWNKMYKISNTFESNIYRGFAYNFLVFQDGSFLLNISYNRNTNSAGVFMHYGLLKFDNNGNIINQKRLNTGDLADDNKLYFHNNTIFIHFSNIILELDTDLNLINKSTAVIKGEEEFVDIYIKNLYWDSDDTILLSGSFYDGTSAFDSFSVMRFNTEIYNAPLNTLTSVKETTNEAVMYYSYSTFANDSIYINKTTTIAAKDSPGDEQPSGVPVKEPSSVVLEDPSKNPSKDLSIVQSNYVYKYDTDLNLIWVKKYSDDNAFDMTLESAGNNIIIEYNDVLGLLNSEFDSCKTTLSSAQSLDKISALLLTTELDNTIEDSVFYVNDVTQVNVSSSSETQFQTVCNFVDEGESVETDENTVLQSPDFSLMTAGSTGADSPEGIQLRWAFSGNLGEKHLPKGNLSANTNNYNKDNDFVKLYRAPYVRLPFLLDLSKAPQVIDDSKECWIYKTGGDIDMSAKLNNGARTLHVYFRNKTRYEGLRIFIDPLQEPERFIREYGDEIIEIESKSEFFFAAKPIPSPVAIDASLYFELLSAEENKLITPKSLSYRNNIQASEFDNSIVYAENGRSVRFRTNNAELFQIELEFYSDFLTTASENHSWTPVGEYGLSTSDTIVQERLDPDPVNNPVNARWLRYNDDDYVKTQNYIDKWNVFSENNGLRKGVREVLEKYINLSENSSNPKAEEYININFSDDNGEILSESETDNGGNLISYLNLLNIAAMDYHVARMLGLGTLDLSREARSGDSYIYLSEYKTNKDVNNEAVEKECQILSMSLPTSTETERLPIPVEISELYKGIPKTQNEDIPVLYDEEGYSFDGKYRFISIINKSVSGNEVNPSFFSNQAFWDSSLYSNPVYAGLECKKGTDRFWQKPELSHDILYYNVDEMGNDSAFETVPIIIPENNQPLYVHRQDKSGLYSYSTYGINIFSRAISSKALFSVDTTIKPNNNLLPPSEIKPWLILPEKPLMFTSQEEQGNYQAITGDDKTFVRVGFSYDASQDLVTHSIPVDSTVSNEDYETVEDYFPNDEDIFADSIEVYFRKELPRNISAKLYHAADDSSDNLAAVFKTKNYVLVSTGETLKSEFPSGTLKDNFIGSVFLVDNKQYVIKDITSDSDGLIFNVYKEEVSRAILSGQPITVNFSSLTTPKVTGNDLFFVSENMQSAPVWGEDKNPNRFPVTIGGNNSWDIHREVITTTSESGQVKRYLEKSRGFWENAKVDKYLEDKNVDDDNDEDNDNNVKVHKGIYKITFNQLFLFDDHFSMRGLESFLKMKNGSVRLFRNKDVDNNKLRSRSVFNVIRTELEPHYGSSIPSFVLYIYDHDFENYADPAHADFGEELQTGDDVSINYYPSYELYLYKDADNDLTKDSVMPVGDQIMKYSIFGLRTVASGNFDMDGNAYRSKFSTPAVIFGQKVIEPQQPDIPTSKSIYATRPDFYGKSTFSFETKFAQKPYGVQFNRVDNIALLNAIYKPETVTGILASLERLGGNNEKSLEERWDNFFDYETLKLAGEYASLPARVIRPNRPYAFPLPDKVQFFEGINNFIETHNRIYETNELLIDEESYGSISLDQLIINSIDGQNDDICLIDFIKEAIDYTFVPLTEVPIIYQHVKSVPYFPLNKKQNIRDKDGYLLKPPTNPSEESDFDMAPMMTILDPDANKTLFTDFTLDGTSTGLYFYASREIGSQMSVGELSPVLGPVKLVNTNPAEAPKIISALPVLENKVLGIAPKIKIDLHSYSAIQNIKRINLYRTTNRLDAESILSMELVKTIENISEAVTDDENVWSVYDELVDFDDVPFGDTFFYRVTVDREVTYSAPVYSDLQFYETITEYAPSQASKIFVLGLVESNNPETPELSLAHDPLVENDEVKNVIFSWKQTCYKGKYHFYKLGSKGNWEELLRVEIDKQDNSLANVLKLGLEDWEVVENLALVDKQIQIPLDLAGLGSLPLFDQQGNRIYSHFKVVAENTSNMFSAEEKTFTIYKTDINEGISSDGTDGMSMEKTFIIR